MTITSPIYSSPSIYRSVMRGLYGPQIDERYRVVDRRIPDGARVVELCCGCGYLYERFLRKRGIDYFGIDLLPAMTSRLRKLGARVVQGDVLRAELPPADYTIMLGSLYHFHPVEARVLRRMAAHGAGLVLEPISNFSQSGNTLIRLLARGASFIGGTSSGFRLTSSRLDEVLREAGVQVRVREDVLDGQYRLAIFDGREGAL